MYGIKGPDYLSQVVVGVRVFFYGDFMYVKVADCRKVADIISKRYEISLDDAGRMIGVLNQRYATRRVIMDVLDGYFDDETWKTAADSIGVKTNILEYKGPVNAEIIPDSFDGLSDGVIQAIKDRISEYCQEYKVDDMRKAPADVWAACCMSIGQYLNKQKITIDKEAQKQHGGAPRDPIIINSLVDVWAYLCSTYNKPALICDFAYFAGVSLSYVLNYDTTGQALTSKDVELAQKLRNIQESALSRRLADGRQNPTGAIFFLKNKHGWQDEKKIEHVNTINAGTVQQLPRFSDAGLIETSEKP